MRGPKNEIGNTYMRLTVLSGVVVRGLPPTVAFLLSPQPRVKLTIDMEEK